MFSFHLVEKDLGVLVDGQLSSALAGVRHGVASRAGAVPVPLRWALVGRPSDALGSALGPSAPGGP